MESRNSKNNYWIRIKDIEIMLEVSNYKAKKIFKEYRMILNDEKLNQLDKSRLPRSWFIKEFEKRHGILINEDDIE